MKINHDYMTVMRAGRYLTKYQQQMAMDNKRRELEAGVYVGTAFILGMILVSLAMLLNF